LDILETPVRLADARQGVWLSSTEAKSRGRRGMGHELRRARATPAWSGMAARP